MPSRNIGFTLLEILIALFIFTILSIITGSALHTLISTHETTTRHAKRLEELQFAFIIISRDMEQIIKRPVLIMNQSENAFSGNSQSLTFTRTGWANPFGQLRSNLQRVEYVLKDNQLIRLSWPMLDFSTHTEPIERILLTNINDIQFDYLDSHREFQNKWSEPGIPKAIRISLDLGNEGKITQIFNFFTETPIETIT